jgi:hypothetical protein
MRRILLAALVLSLAVACTTATTGGGAPTVGIGRDGAVGQTEPGFAVAEPAPDKAGNAGPGTVPLPAVLDPSRKLIVTARVAMEAKDPWLTSDRAQAIATSLGGDVIGLSQSGTGEARSATLVVRVPSDRFTDALRQLRELPDTEVQSSNVDAKDVTDQFVDLEARLRAKQAEEQRYLALLPRAEKIEDILKIDQALAEVRTQIEQLTAQLNSIRSRTDFSTIAMSITPLATIATSTGPYDPAKTMERALAALTALFRVFADLAIWALVFGWIPLLVLAAVFAAQRSRRIIPTTPA